MPNIPPHVLAWQRANSDKKKTEALLSQWFEQRWQVIAFGQMWEGSLSEVNYVMDVMFSLSIPDPENAFTTIIIKAPFERFVQVQDKKEV